MDNVNQGDRTITGGHWAAAKAAGRMIPLEAAFIDSVGAGRKGADQRIPQHALYSTRLLKKTSLRIAG